MTALDVWAGLIRFDLTALIPSAVSLGKFLFIVLFCILFGVALKFISAPLERFIEAKGWMEPRRD